MGMLLLVAVEASLLLSAMLLQVPLPPLASAAAFPRLPKFGGSVPASSQQFKKLKDFLKKHGRDASDVVDIAEKFLPPPPPPGEGHGGSRGDRTTDRAPAETDGLYLADLQVGTPTAQTISGVLDISTQLVWMRCNATCTACRPPSSSFLATKSETFKFLPCDDKTCQDLVTQTCDNNPNPCGYSASYSDTMSTAGYLAWDTFTFGTTAVPNVLFGCSDSTTGADYSGTSGVIGLGRGPLSLVSQLGLSNFSYFLAPDDGASDSQVQLGDVAAPRTGRGVLSAAPHERCIHVDGEELDDDIPAGTFDLRDDGSGGVFLSTTIPVTYLLSDAYRVVRKAFASRISAQPLRKTATAASTRCATRRSPWPASRFDDGGRDLECLTVLPSKGASVLGSLLQTGTTMIYDLDGDQLTFVTMDTDKQRLSSEAPAAASLAMAVAVAVAVGVLL
ncbi:hypothetical protein PVAP13_4NG329000 [Panicum virgatum]|uniref:Peptidase A1 domain-containing protein n=1 Tax=Panicum virgatum TaxID=38727 RepID=A0A8T0THF1_PANVG|nr:hypothetical protein PVAP13_4NG329000 [Panicum virgatum]